jgi:hypothetical protein
MAALADVIPVSGVPADLLAALRERRLAAIVDDAHLGEPEPLDPLWPPVMLEDDPALREALFTNYFVGERIDEETVAIPMPAAASPRWVYLPRREVLHVDEDELRARHLAEIDLAWRRGEALRLGKPAPFATAEIEEIAKRWGTR